MLFKTPKRTHPKLFSQRPSQIDQKKKKQKQRKLETNIYIYIYRERERERERERSRVAEFEDCLLISLMRTSTRLSIIELY